ncbi:hypothetical protein [Leuconostoc falkenbergense]|uniref:hypothetical protein n=1 Tax=Leuconostoc falkenbergense TaxID=2766470 RepID=UPI00293C2BAF|nr:hypothetical protein [Leuconostoc falkenbergense]MDV3545945.1 hypothetical protein [Leuconostoc falkenbergense]
MTPSLKSNHKGMVYVDENSLNNQLQSYVQLRELYTYTEQQLTKITKNFDEKLSHYVKSEDLNAKFIELFKDKRDSFRFWLPVALSTLISLVSLLIAYLASHK